jgi:hypothetical protein
MPDNSFAKRFIGSQAAQPDDQDPAWRPGFGGDTVGGANPISLSLRTKDGRQIDGLSMSLYECHHWVDDGGPIDRLVLIFSVGGVYVEGNHLKRQVEALLEEGRLKRIQEHDSAEIEAIRAHNLGQRKPEEKEPVVLRILVTPDIETRLRSDENLAVIASAMKGGDSETGNAGRFGR